MAVLHKCLQRDREMTTKHSGPLLPCLPRSSIFQILLHISLRGFLFLKQFSTCKLIVGTRQAVVEDCDGKSTVSTVATTTRIASQMEVSFNSRPVSPGIRITAHTLSGLTRCGTGSRRRPS